MAKVLLGLIGSPRRLGNCELFVKEIYRNLAPGWELRMVRLPILDIRPCRACYACLFDEMRCGQKDDFLPALEALAAADAYVVAAPAYLLAANASLKRFLDRGLQFYAFLDRLWAKPAVAVAVAGIEGMEGMTKLNVESFVKLTMGDLRGSAAVYGALPGEALLDPKNLDTARALAHALENPQKTADPAVPRCPVCNGDTFRFLPGGELRCMLCSSSGKYGWEKEGLKIETSPGEHPLFLSYEDAARHAEWRCGMKEKFLARRTELKAVARDYLKIGSWILEK